jgi:hypothetical protein
MLNKEDITFVLQHFSKFELSYDIITHKKVYDANIILAIPDGNKYFAWFTNYKNNNVCFLLQTNENKNILNVQIVNTCFTDKLALGTIFYGTLFYNSTNCKNNSYFCIEDLYYYHGKSCKNLTYIIKLEILRDIFKHDICQTALTNKFTIFGLPLILNNLKLILKEIQLLPYNIREIQFRYFNITQIYAMKYIKPGGTHYNNAIFKITADIEPDIYNLFIYKDGTDVYYDIAFIPNYKTSVMMNKLFRKIKENDNLDAIEESDNEDEFQNNKEDKYVYLNRSFKMNCEYNSKFKRWTPISLANKNDNIISITNLLKKM